MSFQVSWLTSVDGKFRSFDLFQGSQRKGEQRELASIALPSSSFQETQHAMETRL